MVMADATVLVVDDEPELLEIFSIWLKRHAATVLKASNGAEALKVLASQKVNAVVSDIRMPVMDGVALVRSLRDLNLSVHAVIFVSGFGDVSLRDLYSLGVAALIAKPLGRHQLVDTLADSLREPAERWLKPMAEPVQQELTLDFPSLEEALHSRAFELGRGGCRVRVPSAILERTLGFHLCFTQDNLTLEGQGVVRWFDPQTSHAGVEFLYLDPSSRGWVIDHIHSQAAFSYIPA